MKAIPILLITMTVLTACTTPRTMLRHPTTGQIVSCGGDTTSSLAGGMIGYSIQQSADSNCVAAFMAQGFAPISARAP